MLAGLASQRWLPEGWLLPKKGHLAITQRGDKGSKPGESAVIGGQAGYSFQVDAGKKGGEVFFEGEVERWSKVIRDNGIKAGE